jgi:hypothetical protein
MHGRVEAWQKHRCRHAFRPISAGFVAIQLGIQGLDQFFIFTNFSTSARQILHINKAHLRITRSAHDRAVSGAKRHALYTGKYGNYVGRSDVAPRATHLLG